MENASLEPLVSSFYGGNHNSSFLANSSQLLAQNPRPEFTQIKPVPLLVLGSEPQKEGLYLSETAKNTLKSLPGECRVISVSGRSMIGKSSLLDLLLSFFSIDDLKEMIIFREMFLIGDGEGSTTQYIDMYCLREDGKNYIFLDIEGDNDPGRGETGTWLTSNLIQTAVGVSHVHLHNYDGHPQPNLVKNFETTSRVAEQNEIHDVQTKYIFLRRNHFIKNQAERIQKLQIAEDANNNNTNVKSSLHFVPTPPEHFTEKDYEASCIRSTGILCEACRDDVFTSTLLKIRDELKQHLKEVVPFRSGHDLCLALEKLMEINKTEIPFFFDLGCISQARRNKIGKKKDRIKNDLLKIRGYQAQRSFYQEILKTMNDHPSLIKKEEVQKSSNRTESIEESKNSNETRSLVSNQGNENSSETGSLVNTQEGENSSQAEKLAKDKFIQDFDDSRKDLETQVSRMEYLVPELSRFIDQYLLDDKASILDKEEKKALLEAYVVPFEEILIEIIPSLRKYGEMFEFLCENLSNVQMHTVTNLEEYVKAASETRNQAFTISAQLMSSAALGILAREAAAKALTAFFVGGGVIGGIATAILFGIAVHRLRKAINKNKKALDFTRIVGVNDVRDAKEKMKEIKNFVTKLVKNFEKSRETLRVICSEDERKNFTLITKITKAMDGKIGRKNLSPEDRKQLIEEMKAAQNNLERFLLEDGLYSAN